MHLVFRFDGALAYTDAEQNGMRHSSLPDVKVDYKETLHIFLQKVKWLTGLTI